MGFIKTKLVFNGLITNVSHALILVAGLPKPATIPHEKIIRSLFITYFAELTKDDVYYISLPLYHSAALLIALCGTWRTGLFD